ncbi:MAG TPA: TRAP transporter small permease [Gammaproteobacteria bacterium]
MAEPDTAEPSAAERAAAPRSFLARCLDRAEEVFIAATLAFMTLVTFVQVVLRYAFGTGFVWSLEATTYAFAWMILIGMSYCVRTNAHIAVELVTERLPATAARVVGFAALAASLAYCAFMVYGSAVFVGRLVALGNYARDIPLPRWVLTGIMPIAFALLGARLVQAAWRAATGGAGTQRSLAVPGAALRPDRGPAAERPADAAAERSRR